MEARVWIQLVFEVWVFGAHACEQGGHKFFERAFFEVVVQVRSEWVTVSFGEGWMLAGFLASLCTRRPSSSRKAQTSVSKCAGNMKVEDDEEALWMEVSAHCSLNLEFQNQHTTNNTAHTVGCVVGMLEQSHVEPTERLVACAFVVRRTSQK